MLTLILLITLAKLLKNLIKIINRFDIFLMNQIQFLILNFNILYHFLRIFQLLDFLIYLYYY